MLSGNSFSQTQETQARAILPILVQRVIASQNSQEQKITYGKLAEEVGGNRRKLGGPLGCIRSILDELREQWNEDIPHIQGIVVKKDTGLPGDRVIFFLNRDLNPTEREAIFEAELQKVFSYQKWLDVLEALGLPRSAP